MKNLFLNFIFLLFYFSSLSQRILIKGTVLSNENNQFIPYATAQIINTQNIVDGDESGYFEITANKDDSLLISCIGFEQLIIPVSYFKDKNSIVLKENYLKMDDVIVKNPVSYTFGIVNEKMGSSRSGGSEAARSELTTLIEIPKPIESYRISKVFIKGKKFEEENSIRLHIYAVNENGLPGEELLKKPMIIKKEEFNNNNKIITIDVKDQNIILENASFFIGVQWMTSVKVKPFIGPEIIQTYKESKILSYYRQTTFNKNYWQVQYKDAILVFVDGKLPAKGTRPSKGNPLNMCASAEIEAFTN